MINENFALTTLSENPEYFEDVIRLIEDEFHYSEGHHYEKDFAPLMDTQNFENCYLYIDSQTNSVAAHLAVCERIIVKNNQEMKVLFIGGIATHKQYRRKQLFKHLMEHALAEHTGVGLFILWSDLENIYEKFNFYRTGGLIETGTRNFSSSERPSGYEKTKFNLLSDEEFHSLINLYKTFNETHFFTVKREEREWSVIREMDSIDLFVRRDLSGNVTRYFCVNKGRDLTNIIHEVSALDKKEFKLLMKDLESFKVWMPETESERFKNSDVFYTAFFKIGNLNVLNSFLQNITQSQLNVKKATEEVVQFEFKNSEFTVSPKDFLQYLFGPKPLVEFEPFGLSVYVAGADSI